MAFSIRNAIQKLLGWGRTSVTKHFITADSVLFSHCGSDVTASDIVNTAKHRVCEAVSKCSLSAVKIMRDPRRVVMAGDDLNGLFASRVNPICGLKDFLYKVAWLTLTNKNCFIYWAYDEVPIGDSGKVRRVTRGLYPIEYANVKLYEADDEMRVELTSLGGDVVLDMPYSDVIHIRHGYGANRFLGGDRSGRADTRGILENMQTMHVIKEAIPKSLQASLGLKGILTMKTVANADKRELSRDEFEKHLISSNYGIVATDYASEFTPININATDIPSNVLTFIRDELLAPFGVSLPIYLGKYTDDDYTAFYQTAVEGILIEIAEAMRITLFTPRQLAAGYTIKFYDRLVQSLSFEKRIHIVELAKDSNLLNRADQRELLGYEPDDQPDRVSLNYVDVSIANEYQLGTLTKKQTTAAGSGSGEKKED